MEALMSLLLLIISAWSQGEPLTEAVQRRRDSFGVYASEFAHDYETFAFAAIPLHSPLPILHILSPTPLRLPLYKHPRHPTLKPADSTHQHIYAPSMNHLLYATPFPEREEIQTTETILYARPNSNGGYTYRRRPVNKRNASKNNTLKEPVIIRVHKYRIVRD
ncbi:uncharacterized protein LOC116413228 [Galleria mellonella]|uniref:Uncharacterized protein LOC116413228 n=1 Tax=Galleria mellonella TaxID=7137 RepID=A0A6J3C563_GALME|nr:uncharacterized protein LOC116413228 [Galleria mellonella]